MKRYNIKPISKKFEWGEMMVVELGEDGRARKKVYVPYHAREDAQFLKIGTTRSGRPKIVEDTEAGNAWLAYISAEGAYTRNTYGSVYCLKDDAEKIKVIAYGHGAYGDAGRIGDWYDFLVVVPDNTWLYVRPSGGAEKRPRYWLFFGAERVYEVRKEEMDAFLEMHEAQDPREQELVDLVDIAEENYES